MGYQEEGAVMGEVVTLGQYTCTHASPFSYVHTLLSPLAFNGYFRRKVQCLVTRFDVSPTPAHTIRPAHHSAYPIQANDAVSFRFISVTCVPAGCFLLCILLHSSLRP